MKGHILYDSTYTDCPKQTNPCRQEVGWWLPRAGEGDLGSDCSGGQDFLFGGDGNALELDYEILNATKSYTLQQFMNFTSLKKQKPKNKRKDKIKKLPG